MTGKPAKNNTEINDLTPELLHTFIKRIEVGGRARKYSRSAPQDIVIHCRDIGIVDDMPQELEDILLQAAEPDLEIANSGACASTQAPDREIF